MIERKIFCLMHIDIRTTITMLLMIIMMMVIIIIIIIIIIIMIIIIILIIMIIIIIVIMTMMLHQNTKAKQRGRPAERRLGRALQSLDHVVDHCLLRVHQHGPLQRDVHLGREFCQLLLVA